MRKVLAVILAAVLVGIVVACSAQETATPGVSVRGEITSRNENQDGSVSILVEGEKESDTEYDRASVTVTDKTTITKDGGESSADELQIGVRVEVRISGPVMESYPVQGGASEVVILAQE